MQAEGVEVVHKRFFQGEVNQFLGARLLANELLEFLARIQCELVEVVCDREIYKVVLEVLGVARGAEHLFLTYVLVGFEVR